MDFLVTAHAWWQYAVLLAVVVSLIFAFRDAMMDSTSEMAYRVTTVVVDIQVALGIIIWIFNEGWALDFMQGWLHPIIGIGAVGVVHGVVARARKGHPEVANRTVRTGLIIVIVLVVAAIGIAEMA